MNENNIIIKNSGTTSAPTGADGYTSSLPGAITTTSTTFTGNKIYIPNPTVPDGTRFVLEYEFLSCRGEYEGSLLKELYESPCASIAYKSYVPQFWYDRDYDLRTLSKKFPMVVLKLFIFDGSPFGMKLEYYCNGSKHNAKTNITFEPFDHKKLDKNPYTKEAL